MEAKRVSSILLFSLLTLTVCNRVNTMDDDKKPKKKSRLPKLFGNNNAKQALAKAGCTEQLTQCEERVTELENDTEENLVEIARLQEQNNLLNAESTTMQKEISTLADVEKQLADRDKNLAKARKEVVAFDQKLLDIEKESANKDRLLTTRREENRAAVEELANTRSLLKKYKVFGKTPQIVKQQFSTLEQELDAARIAIEGDNDSGTLGLKAEFAQESERVSQLEDERDDLQKEYDVLKKKNNDEDRALAKRCRPYFFGELATVIIDYLFSCLASTEKFGKNENFKLLHESVGDSKKLQFVSLVAAGVGGKPHSVINGFYEKNHNSKNDLHFCLENVGGEMINALILRSCWKHIAARSKPMIERLQKSENRVLKIIDTLVSHPLLCPLKKPCQDFVRLTAIRTLVSLEKLAKSKYP